MTTKNEFDAALDAYLALSTKYHQLMSVNYNRTDLTQLCPVGGVQGTNLFSVECGGSGLVNIPSCGWKSVIERGVDDGMWITPNNQCPTCHGGIVVVDVKYSIGAVQPEYRALPTPETKEEYDRIGLEQHKLHVALYESRCHLKSFTA